MALIIVLRNLSTTALEVWPDYEYEVRINERVIETGTVKGHFRPWGWQRLIARFLDQRIITTTDTPAIPAGPVR